MEALEIKKKLVIEYNCIEGTMVFHNEDEMTYSELLAALEYTKWMIHKDWLKGES